MRRVWVFGAPGAGVTTLGRALAEHMGVLFFDTDDYYWFTDDPLPYRRKRNAQHRLQLLVRDLADQSAYVVSGALLGWGEPLVEHFDAVVYRWLPAATRLARIRQREMERYGAARLLLGGDLNKVFEKFLSWAEMYDTAPADRLRSRAAEEQWLSAYCRVPVIRLAEDLPVELLVEQLLQSLKGPHR